MRTEEREIDEKLREEFQEREISRTQRRMASSGMLRRVFLVRTAVSEEHSSSFIRVTRSGELGTTSVLRTSQETSVGFHGLLLGSFTCLYVHIYIYGARTAQETPMSLHGLLRG
jgi:hypothetical protein